MKPSQHTIITAFKNQIHGKASPFEYDALFNYTKEEREERFAIYRNNVIQSLKKVITDRHTLVGKLVGDAFTEGLAALYASKHLPSKADLSSYALDFADFIEPLDQIKSLPYLPDIARLDTAIHIASSATDDSILNLSKLEDFENQECLMFNLRNSAQLIDSKWPILKIHELCIGEKSQKIDMEAGAEYALIYRPDLYADIIPLTHEEFQFLTALEERRTLGQAYNIAVQYNTNFDLTACLQKHFALETFSDICPNESAKGA